MTDLQGLTVSLVIALLMGALFYGGVAGSDTNTYMTEAADWCEDHGGELQHAQALWHGGLHCELDNGTTVHMDEVVG